jgi:ankyrin repeat protein
MQMGQTAMHVAALWGNLEAIKVLLANGANVNHTNSRCGCTINCLGTTENSSNNDIYGTANPHSLQLRVCKYWVMNCTGTTLHDQDKGSSS